SPLLTRRGVGIVLSILWQGKDKERFVASRSICGRHHGDVLFAVFPLVSHRNSGRVVIQANRPEFLAGLGIEGGEAAVTGGADEDESACGNHWAAEARGSDVLFPFGHVVIYAEWDAPGELTRRGIHCHQTRPGRTEAR